MKQQLIDNLMDRGTVAFLAGDFDTCDWLADWAVWIDTAATMFEIAALYCDYWVNYVVGEVVTTVNTPTSNEPVQLAMF